MAYVDYVVDAGDGEEEIYKTKRAAIRRANKIANSRKVRLHVYRWAGDYGDDIQLDEGFDYVAGKECWGWIYDK